MTDQALDDLARRVMLDAARQEYGDFFNELPEHDFSPEFEKKMRKLVRRANHPIRYRVAQMAACLLLAALLSGCTVLAVSPAAREAFVGWVRETYETYFVYRFFGEDHERLSKMDIFYRPAYVPDGYQTIRMDVRDGMTNIVYQDDSNHIAVFTYFGDISSSVFQVEWEGAVTYKNVFVNGISADLYLDQNVEEANALLWVDESNGAAFRISAVLDETELVRMAESVEAVPFEYSPVWIPEGYTLYDKFVASGNAMTLLTYTNQAEGIISIAYEPDRDGSVFYHDPGSSIEKHVFVNGISASLYLPSAEGEHAKLLWSDPAKHAFFRVSACLSEEDILHIAESIQAMPPVQSPHRPTWLPEGYSINSDRSAGWNIQLEYAHEDGKQIQFRFWKVEDNKFWEEMKETTDDLTPQNVLVNGFPAQLYTDVDGVNHLVWSGNEPDDNYWITAPLTGDELIQIAESVGSTQSSNNEEVIP